MSGPAPDAKLEHLLTHYFLASRPEHEIQLIIKENNFYQFKDFTACEEQSFLDMNRKKGNVMVPFDRRYIKSINDALLYYQFMINNNNEVITENPDQLVKEDFENWRDLAKPKSIAVFTPEQKRQDELWKEYARNLSVSTAAATTPPTTTTTPVVISTEMVSNEEEITLEIHTKITSNEEGISNNPTKNDPRRR